MKKRTLIFAAAALQRPHGLRTKGRGDTAASYDRGDTGNDTGTGHGRQ